MDILKGKHGRMQGLVYEDILNRFEKSIHESVNILSSMGFENALDIGDRILMARNKIL